jgi:NAD(P)H dehydrogenase (quinone)
LIHTSFVGEGGSHTRKYDEQTKAKAVRLVAEHRGDYASEWEAITTVAGRLGMTPETLRRWIRQAAVDAGRAEGVFSQGPGRTGMQGRIAMAHALGDAVTPLDQSTVSANVFTAPEIATVGLSQAVVDAGGSTALVVKVPLSDNARAKTQGVRDGFVKLFCLPNTGIVVGGVVVAPRASELIHPIALAVGACLTVDQVAQSFTVYPSMSGSVAEAARRLHLRS